MKIVSLVMPLDDADNSKFEENSDVKYKTKQHDQGAYKMKHRNILI